MSKISKKASKGQISIFQKSRQTIRQNEALDLSISKTSNFRSRKVIKGQKSQKRAKKVKFRTSSKVVKLYVFPFFKLS